MRVVRSAPPDYDAQRIMSPGLDPSACGGPDTDGAFAHALGAGPPASTGADVPVTLLLGRGWRGVGRSVRALTTRLAGRLGHAVNACDVEAAGAPFADIVGAAVERGASRLVL